MWQALTRTSRSSCCAFVFSCVSYMYAQGIQYSGRKEQRGISEQAGADEAEKQTRNAQQRTKDK